MLEIMEYIAKNGKVSRKQLSEVFNSYQLKALPGLVRRKVLHSYDLAGDGTSAAYERWYELHNDYRKELRIMGNHNADGYMPEMLEWIEMDFDPQRRVRIRIHNDMYEYTPENGFTKNGEHCYGYRERARRYAKKKNEKAHDVVINSLDEDLKQRVRKVYQEAKAEQGERNNERREPALDDILKDI